MNNESKEGKTITIMRTNRLGDRADKLRLLHTNRPEMESKRSTELIRTNDALQSMERHKLILPSIQPINKFTNAALYESN